MKKTLTLILIALFATAILGCPSGGDDDGHADDSPAAADGSEDGGERHGHSHGDGDADALTWFKKELMHEGYELNLGLHGPHLHAGEAAEVAVEVKKDSEPVSDAKVFVTLLDGDAENVIVEEQATVFEPTTPEEAAHYAQAELAIPQDAGQVTIRYRIEFTDADEFSSNVLMPVE